MSLADNSNTDSANTAEALAASTVETKDATLLESSSNNNSLLQSQVQTATEPGENHKQEASKDDEDEDEDELLDGLEDEALFSGYREHRMEELRQQMQQMQTMKENDHGTFKDLESDKQILEVTTTTKHCIVHFYHTDFRRCQIMDKHLEKMAKKYFQTRFARMDVEKAPFLVERMKIQMLPCVVMFVNGISVDRVVGFEELGNTDQFTTRLLEKRLARSGVIK
ncbi:thioredoxin-like protein [Syncephalis fuscata]|nr:thioredoxin-like protein [Syncephalis fuscata]